MYLSTERLVVRGFEENDWKAVYDYTSDSTVMTYIPEGVFSEEQAKIFVNENQGDQAKYFPVILKGEDKLIGHIVFHKYFGDHTYEIGWVFNSNYYGKGYASEAAKAVLGYAFDELKVHRVVATCQPENIGSYRIMEKIGMRKEGYFKKCIPAGDGWWDEYYYAVLREEWNK